MLRLSIILVVLLMSFSTGNAKNDTLFINNDIQLIPLRDSVYLHTSWHSSESYGRFPSNGLVYVKNGEAIIIDTPMDEEKTKQLCDFLQDSLGVEIKAFIAGHFHDDCIGGIDYIHSIGVWSFGNELTAKKCTELGITGPRSTFKSSMNLYFNGETIQLRYLGPGHSFDNIVVYFPSEKILFGGCLVKSTASENLGNLADAVVSEWDITVENVIKTFPEAEIVVPGHGTYGGKELLQHTIDLLREYKNTNTCIGHYDPDAGMDVFEIAEEMPQYPGGEEKLFSFIIENIRFKSEASYAGTVWVEFIVNKEGKLTCIQIIRGIDPDIDKEIVRVIKLMPDWTPGKCNGMPVNVKMWIPVRIIL